MGTFSKIHRFHEAGKGTNVNNVERFGVPAYSLYTSTKVFNFYHHIEVMDDNENVKYISRRSKLISLHDKTDVFKASGEQVAHIEKKIFTLHQRHFITMHTGMQFELSNEFFHLIKDITNVEGLGWQLRGNVLGLNFELYDEVGNVVAVIGQKMLSIHDKYCIDIYQPALEEVVVAILVALQHMIRDRKSAGSASAGSASSSSGS